MTGEFLGNYEEPQSYEGNLLESGHFEGREERKNRSVLDF